jgi:hypothetical protein
MASRVKAARAITIADFAPPVVNMVSSSLNDERFPPAIRFPVLEVPVNSLEVAGSKRFRLPTFRAFSQNMGSSLVFFLGLLFPPATR